MEKTCVILDQVIQNQSTQISFELKNILLERFKKITKPDFGIGDLGIREIYIFECQKYLFVLYAGQLTPFSGWNKKIKDSLEEKINKDCKEFEGISFIDHTYNSKGKEKDKFSRRLRALGGGIRRLLENLADLTFLTKNEIFDNLDVYVISGNLKNINAQLFAIKNNTKLPNEMRVKMSNS